jgi:hypothetical protein
MKRSNRMDLQIATVVSCSETGCLVQPIHEQVTIETRYSQPVVKYNIPIHPQHFVIVDSDTTPPETIFRWRRGTVTGLHGDHVEVDMEGKQVPAQRDVGFEGELQVGDEVVLAGFNDQNRHVIDTVVDGAPVHPGKLRIDWFPRMKDAQARALE